MSSKGKTKSTAALVAVADTSNSMKNVSRHAVLGLPVPLAPVAEQSRIVARVTELRQRLSASQRTQAQLAEALVASPPLKP